jgi:uncharacterized protein YndB with AHSA1/START domain
MKTQIGPLAVRRSIHIKAPPERVWREFETFEAFKGWFGTPDGELRHGSGHELLKYEPSVGGEVELRVNVAGEVYHFGSRVLVFDPPTELTFEDQWIPPRWPEPTLITIRLTPALGGTVVELFHHAFENIGPEGAEEHRGHEGGWTTRQLEALRNAVENG